MSGNSGWIEREQSLCVTWSTEFLNFHQSSPVFGFGNIECRLEFKTRLIETTHFRLYLAVSEKNQSVQHFNVVSFARIREAEAFNTQFATSEDYLIWESDKNEISEYEPDFLEKNSSLTFVVVFMRDLAKEDQSVQANLITSLDDVCSDFSKLLASGEASDAQLKCGDIKRPVHRSVLSARSSVLSAMFRKETQESATGQVDIDDINPDLLDIFLTFVYTGRIPETFSEDRYPDLYALGDKNAVHSLKRLCFEGMMDRLTQNNFHSLLALVDGHGDEACKDRVVECIADHPQWLDTGSWIQFSEEHSKLALHVYRKSHEGSRSKKRPYSEITV